MIEWAQRPCLQINTLGRKHALYWCDVPLASKTMPGQKWGPVPTATMQQHGMSEAVLTRWKRRKRRKRRKRGKERGRY